MRVCVCVRAGKRGDVCKEKACVRNEQERECKRVRERDAHMQRRRGERAHAPFEKLQARDGALLLVHGSNLLFLGQIIHFNAFVCTP